MQRKASEGLTHSLKTLSHRQLLLFFVLFCVILMSIFEVFLSKTSTNQIPIFGITLGLKQFQPNVNGNRDPSTNPTIKVENLKEFDLNGSRDASTNPTIELGNLKEFDLNGRREAWCTDAPRLEPFHPSIRHLVKVPSQPECITREFPLLFNATLNATVVPVKSVSSYRNLSILSCCYKVITREWPDDVNVSKTWPDDRHSFSKACFPLSLESETIIPLDHEFIAIYCRFNLTKKKEGSNGTDHKHWVRGQLNISTKTTKGVPEVLVGAPNIRNGEKIVDMFAFVHMKSEVEVRRDDELEKKQWSIFFEEKINVLILGFDSTSHMNFIRTFGKSHEFLVNNMSALEMNWFNKVGVNTYPCVIPMLTGKSQKEIDFSCAYLKQFDTCPFIWKKFSKRGYATFYNEDCPGIGTLNHGKIGFKDSAATDYYYRTFAIPAENHLGRLRIIEFQCRGPRLTVQSLLDQTIQFVNKMESHRKNYFGYMFSTCTTHDDMNQGFWADPYLLDTLKWLNNRLSNNTLLIVMSDHGQRLGDIRHTRQGQLETHLPALYFVLPQTLRVKYARAFHNIWGNQNRLVTAFDLHKTLVDILEAQDKLGDLTIKRREERLKREAVLPRGISLFLPVPPERSCVQAEVPPEFCACSKMIPLHVTDSSVLLAANSSVDHINRFWLVKSHQKCMPLRLYEVVSALTMVGTGMENWEGYQINFLTEPGYAFFQALVTRSHPNDSWQVSGIVERINKYGNQSSCVDDETLKNYCFCRNHDTISNKKSNFVDYAVNER